MTQSHTARTRARSQDKPKSGKHNKREDARRNRPAKPHSENAVELYLDALATSGRAPMASVLTRVAAALEPSVSLRELGETTLNATDMQRIKIRLIDDGASANTVNMALAGLRGVLKWQFQLGMIDSKSYLNTKLIRRIARPPSKPGRQLQRSDILAVEKVFSRDVLLARRKRDKALLWFGLGAGLRVSEIVALCPADIETRRRVIQVVNGKGGKHRLIPISAEVLAAIKPWYLLRKDAEGELFCGIGRTGELKDQTLTTAGVRSIFLRLHEEANIPSFTPHDLRRTYVSRLLEQGVDLNVVAQLTGHADISTTSLYDRRGDKQMFTAAKKLNYLG